MHRATCRRFDTIYWRVTDGQTDGQTDGIREMRALRRAVKTTNRETVRYFQKMFNFETLGVLIAKRTKSFLKIQPTGQACVKELFVIIDYVILLDYIIIATVC